MPKRLFLANTSTEIEIKFLRAASGVVVCRYVCVACAIYLRINLAHAALGIIAYQYFQLKRAVVFLPKYCG